MGGRCVNGERAVRSARRGIQGCGVVNPPRLPRILRESLVDEII